MVACVGVVGWKSRPVGRVACRLGLVGALAWSLLSSAPSAAEPVATAADTALILAGLSPARGSALEPLTRSQAFQQHAREFDQSWTRLEAGQLARIREWSTKEIAPTAAPLFYFFSGPDYLYAGSFFPAATTYVLAGLEPVGPLPRVSETSLRALPQLRGSLNTVMSYSFFKTAEMRVRFEAGTFTGTLPILYIFLARAGATIEATTLISLDEAGREVAADALSARASVNGAKIVFTSGDGIRRTLYYFQTDISDRGPSVAQFLDFCRGLGQGDGFIKSASYLMHGGNFARAREFLLANTRTLLQDDSGIPLRHFSEPDWKLTARGRYVGPINLFGQFYQPQLASLHRLQRPEQLPFGVGYRWRPNESSLLLATRRGARAEHAFKD
jgi:hypothetical protein